MSIRAIAWDVDGTLVDSEPLHHRALLAGSARFGVDLSDLPDQAFRGVHMGDVWAMLRPRMPATLDEDEWRAAINRHYVDHRHELTAMPEALDTIRALAALALPQVCVSNSARIIVDANLDALGIARYMTFFRASTRPCAENQTPGPIPKPPADSRSRPTRCWRWKTAGPGSPRQWRQGCNAPPWASTAGLAIEG